MKPPKAIHLPGGNYFDNVMIDVEKSIQIQEQWINNVQKHTVCQSRSKNYFNLACLVLAKKTHFHEFLVNVGLNRQWFDEFVDYWRDALDGRPLTVLDFHNLRFHYRTKSQYTRTLNWDNPQEHLKNWQSPNNTSSIFNYVYKLALQPISSRRLPRILKENMRILEYGCSLAPMYRTWRKYFNHIPTQWVLADIANLSFHYARHTYGRDLEAEFVLIKEDMFSDPLKQVDEAFDLIVVSEVFEHLDKPRYIAEYLLNRLNKGGLFYFDYIRSEAIGLDTVAGLEERIPTLEFLSSKLEFVYGNFHIEDKSLGTCIGRKR